MDLGLSKRGEYVVRSALALARAYPSGEPLKLREVSDGMGVPRTFVSQILGDLVHAGLAISSFGVRGGYRLARPPEDVNLLDVVEAGEGPLERAECGRASSCPWRADCPLLDTFSAATVGVRATLTAATLADLVRDGWSVEAETVCPVRAAEGGGGGRASGRRDRVRHLPTAGRGALPGAGGRDLSDPSEDVVEHPVELVGARGAPPGDRRPQRGSCEDGGVPDDNGQRSRGDEAHGDRHTGHDSMVRRSPVPAEPGDRGPADPGWHGAPTESTDLRDPRDDGDGQGRHRRAITVVIVDDHVLVREGSVQLLEAEPDIEVVGMAGSGEDGIDLIEGLRPDVALVDINLPGMSGLELARRSRDRRLPTRMLIVSAYDDYAYVTEALEVGVGGYLLKTASAQELVDSLRLVVEGVTVLDRAVASRLRRRLGGGPAVPRDEASLSPREADVLRLLVEGRTNKEIAAALFLGLRTVESHVSSVLGKLGATSRTQAVAHALRHRLVPPMEDHRAGVHGTSLPPP